MRSGQAKRGAHAQGARKMDNGKLPIARGVLLRFPRAMREIARVWEVDLKNRASAVMVWSELHVLLPHDQEAQAAIARLQGAAQ